MPSSFVLVIKEQSRDRSVGGSAGSAAQPRGCRRVLQVAGRGSEARSAQRGDGPFCSTEQRRLYLPSRFRLPWISRGASMISRSRENGLLTSGDFPASLCTAGCGASAAKPFSAGSSSSFFNPNSYFYIFLSFPS